MFFDFDDPKFGFVVDAVFLSEDFEFGLRAVLVFEVLAFGFCFDALLDFEGLGFLAAVEFAGVGFLTGLVELPDFFCVVVWLKTGNSKKQEIKTTAKYFINNTTASSNNQPSTSRPNAHY